MDNIAVQQEVENKLIAVFVGQRFKGRFIIDTYKKSGYESLDAAVEEITTNLQDKLKFETTRLKTAEKFVVIKATRKGVSAYFLFHDGMLNNKGASLILYKYKDT